MPEKSPEQEPSIEEILASIRQIIADDDEEPAKPVAAAPAPAAPPTPPPAKKSDVFELTEIVKDAPVAAPPSPPKKPIEVDLLDTKDDTPLPEQDDQSLLTDTAASATLSGFARLASRTPVERSPAASIGGITLEDIVRDLMRPMLRDWLDQNLHPLIEKLVARELEKLARQARDE